MKKTIIIYTIIAVIVCMLLMCGGTKLLTTFGNRSSDNMQIGEPLEISSWLSAGTLQMTVTEVTLITDGNALPPREFFFEKYNHYVSSDGTLTEGSYLIVLDVEVESIDATAQLDLTNDDPYLFRADSLLTLVDLTEKQGKSYYYQYMDYFSLMGSNNTHPFAYNLQPGDSIEFSVGFFVGHKRDGAERDLSQIRACTSSGNPESAFIDLNLDEIQID